MNEQKTDMHRTYSITLFIAPHLFNTLTLLSPKFFSLPFSLEIFASECVRVCLSLVFVCQICNEAQQSTSYHIHRPRYTHNYKYKSSRRSTNESLCTCSFSRSFSESLWKSERNAIPHNHIVDSSFMSK